MQFDFQLRVKQFIQRMQQQEIDAIVLFNQSSIRYFTGFRSNSLTESVLIIEKDGTIAFLVPKLDYKRAVRDCWIDTIESFLEDTPDYLAPLRKMVKANWRTVGIERVGITMNHLDYVQSIFRGELRSIDDLITQQFKLKTPAEVTTLRKSAAIASLTMDAVKDYVAKNDNITEQEATGFAKYIMEKNGAELFSFEPFIMSGLDGALPRRISTDKVIAPHELILFDMGAIYQGYCSDITRTFALDSVNAEQQEIFDIALAAQQHAISAIKPGQSAHFIDSIARNFITENGYGEAFPHLTGHGIGVSIHEYPIVDQGEESMLEENMVITIEPGIYVDGIGAARIEDMILVTSEGYEVLTSSPRELLIR